MKPVYVLSLFVLAIVAIPIFSLAAAKNTENLVYNSSFEEIGPNGDPVGWFRGGYGQNIRGHDLAECENTFVYRPDCLPNTSYRLVTSISDYENGDSKWYFKDVKTVGGKEYFTSFYYQAYTWYSGAILRYTLKDGTYKYEFLTALPQGVGGNGYVSWLKAEHTFTTPKDAKSVTIFFTVQQGGPYGCEEGYFCPGPNYGTLSIANVFLSKVK